MGDRRFGRSLEQAADQAARDLYTSWSKLIANPSYLVARFAVFATAVVLCMAGGLGVGPGGDGIGWALVIAGIVVVVIGELWIGRRLRKVAPRIGPPK